MVCHRCLRRLFAGSPDFLQRPFGPQLFVKRLTEFNIVVGHVRRRLAVPEEQQYLPNSRQEFRSPATASAARSLSPANTGLLVPVLCERT